jgi:hypothetical protein
VWRRQERIEHEIQPIWCWSLLSNGLWSSRTLSKRRCDDKLMSAGHGHNMEMKNLTFGMLMPIILRERKGTNVLNHNLIKT